MASALEDEYGESSDSDGVADTPDDDQGQEMVEMSLEEQYEYENPIEAF